MNSGTYANIHVIGLGGTGANVIQALMESKKTAELLSKEDFHMACMALDVADGDLSALQASYKETIAKMQEKGVPVDRLWLKTLNVKFNTPNALFEFMEKYDNYLLKEGIVVNNYKPWIESSASIPPLAGGVGRMRALSKAVYDLNYYHYVELNGVMSVFKDKVLTSKYQPVVMIVFGLGGGTGSGLIFDFCRHLRSKLGSAVPIVGLAVLPSSADDLLARGAAPYATLTEAELLFNRGVNDRVAKTFGEAYRNPFTALFFLPLDPVYNNKSSLISAKRELDDAITDILNVFMNFDLADLLSRVGSNNDFGSNWVHSIEYLRVRYPIEDYLRYLQQYLKFTEMAGSFMKTKKDLLSSVNEILKLRVDESRELFRSHLVSIGDYRAETFDREVDDLLHRGGRYDGELRRQIKGLEDFIAYYNDKWSKPFKTMQFPVDSVENAIVQNMARWREEVSQLSKTYDDFQRNFPSYANEFENSVTASKAFTSGQLRQLRSYMNLLALINTAIETIHNYLRAKFVADELRIRYSKDESIVGRRAVNLSDTELVPLFKAASTMLTRPETEVKMIEQFLPGIRLVKKNVESRYKEQSEEGESIARQLTEKETEEKRVTSDADRIRVDLSGKKRQLSRRAERLKTEMAVLGEKAAEYEQSSRGLKAELELMTGLEKNLETTAQYRKDLVAMVSQLTELNTMMSGIISTESFFERVVELSENEQLKIMQRILQEEEETLRGDGILKEIVDKDRFKDMVKSFVRIFSVANYAGLSDSYRSDMMWATVGIPTGLWDQDMQVMLSSTLNPFSSVEASKSISIRQIPQVNTWTITFLIILAKARADQIEKFTSMRNDAEAVRKSEKPMFRSFLLEQGVQDPSDYVNKLEASPVPRAPREVT